MENNDVPAPVMMPIPVSARESRLVLVTKFLSWLTAVLLATAVLVSLVSVTTDRNELKTQLREQSEELACRSAANTAVNVAQAERQILLGDQNLILGEIVVAIARDEGRKLPPLIDDLKVANNLVRESGRALEEASLAQIKAQTGCVVRN